MTDLKRRTLLKATLAGGVIGAAAGAGLLAPIPLFAAASKSGFDAENLPDALKAVFGSDALIESAEVELKAPDIAENGAVVPITVSTDIAGAESITIFVENNMRPLSGIFALGPRAAGFASTRIRMGKTSNVVVVVKAGDKLYSAKKEVKVTIGGCGG